MNKKGSVVRYGDLTCGIAVSRILFDRRACIAESVNTVSGQAVPKMGMWSVPGVTVWCNFIVGLIAPVEIRDLYCNDMR